jgi:hypothetical protein
MEKTELMKKNSTMCEFELETKGAVRAIECQSYSYEYVQWLEYKLEEERAKNRIIEKQLRNKESLKSWVDAEEQNPVQGGFHLGIISCLSIFGGYWKVAPVYAVFENKQFKDWKLVNERGVEIDGFVRYWKQMPRLPKELE